MATKPYRPGSLQWPVTKEQWQQVNETFDDIYRELKRRPITPASTAPVLSPDGTFGDPANFTAPRIVITDGEITAVSDATIVLPNTAVAAGSYGVPPNIPQFTVDAKGRITAAIDNHQTGLNFIEEHLASGSATLDFTGISADYDDYLIEIINLVPATNNTDLWLRCSTDGGATFDSGNNYASQVFFAVSGFSTGVGANSGLSKISVCGNVSSAANFAGVNASLRLSNPASALYKPFSIHGSYRNNDTNLYGFTGHGHYLVTTAVNAFRLLMSSGNIASGIVRLYGVY